MGTGDDAAAAPAAVQRPDEATRYRAVMQLSAAGDAIGYFGGRWEFEYSGPVIHVQLKQLGGLEQIDVSRRSWPVSDDTVLHLATAEGASARACSGRLGFNATRTLGSAH